MEVLLQVEEGRRVMAARRIESGYFVAAFTISDGKVIEAAPIIKWMIGKDMNEIRRIAKNKGFDLQELNIEEEK